MTVFVAVLVVALCAIVAMAVVQRNNPLTNVADELRSPLPATVVESVAVPVLRATTRSDLEVVLPGTFRLSYRTIPLLAWLLAVFMFPVGLLALWFLRETQTLTVSIAAEGSGSRIRVFGRVHEKLALALGRSLQVQLQRVARRG